MPKSDAALSTLDGRLHLALLGGLVQDGAIPAFDDLASALGISASEIPGLLKGLVQADYLALNEAGLPICLYPFSLVPTTHVVVIDGARRFAMCAIDALGVARMLGRDIAIEDVCAVCNTPIHLNVAPGRIIDAAPSETVVIARQSGSEPACETCCPFTVFACSQEHGEIFAAQMTETSVVSLEEALRHGEAIFGDFLDDTLPARRRRSVLTAERLQT